LRLNFSAVFRKVVKNVHWSGRGDNPKKKKRSRKTKKGLVKERGFFGGVTLPQ